MYFLWCTDVRIVQYSSSWCKIQEWVSKQVFSFLDQSCLRGYSIWIRHWKSTYRSNTNLQRNIYQIIEKESQLYVPLKIKGALYFVFFRPYTQLMKSSGIAPGYSDLKYGVRIFAVEIGNICDEGSTCRPDNSECATATYFSGTKRCACKKDYTPILSANQTAECCMYNETHRIFFHQFLIGRHGKLDPTIHWEWQI